MSADSSRVRRVHTSDDFGGIDLDVIDAGTPGDPVIVLCHGFPESKHSWRHQIDPLVSAGYRVLVPDQRGYGSSSAPRDVAAYRSDRLSADLIALSMTLIPSKRPSSATTGVPWWSGILPVITRTV